MPKETNIVDPLPITVSINKAHIWPSGNLGKVTISQEFGNDLELTLEQAETLIVALQMKLKKE